MKRIVYELCFWAIVALCATRWAVGQEPTPTRPDELKNFPPEVDWTEISRWGDRVVVSGEGHRDGGDVLFSMAMDPPADDSDRWYITVWGPSSDPGTAAIVKAFETDPNLSPFVADPPAHLHNHKAWSHFNWYKAEDPTQDWRFKDFKISKTGPWPVITIQPPSNGSVGKPSTIVDRIEGPGLGKTPADLRKRITSTVALYCQKLAQSGWQPPRNAVEEFYEDPTNVRSGSHSQQPFPWGPETPPPATPVNPVWPVNGPVVEPPAPSPVVAPVVPGKGIFDFLTGPNAAAFYLLVIMGLRVWENVAPKFGFPGTAAKLLAEILQRLNPPNPPPPPVVGPAPSPAPGPLPNPNSYPPNTVLVPNPNGGGGWLPVTVPIPSPAPAP